MYKSSKIILVLVVVLVVVLGFGGYYIVKMNDKISEQGNIINSIFTNNGVSEKVEENEESNYDERKNKNTSNNMNNTSVQDNKNSSNNVNNTVVQKNETGKNISNSEGDYVIVNREGMEDKIYMKKYISSLGYSMMYDNESLTVSNYNGEDCYNSDLGGVYVSKENISYKNMVAKLSNTKDTTVNGMEAVCTTSMNEAAYLTTYYVSGGEGITFVIKVSGTNQSEFIEGMGTILNAMVQTFSII